MSKTVITRHKPTIEELKKGFGRVVEFRWGRRGRIIQTCDTYITVDFPDRRIYFDNGKLSQMPTKKVYFKTNNPIWKPDSIVRFNDSYKFKLAKFKQGMLVVKQESVQPNIIPPLFIR